MNSPLHTTTTLGDFELLGLDLGEGTPEDLAGDAGDWIPVAVPGGVHGALLAAGRIEHPFYGANERKDSWIETKEWWYRARFAAPRHEPGARVRLRFEGLDTVADVWLNGEPLGHHENQFRPAEFDVAALLEPENTLLVRFNPPLLGREVPPSVAQTMVALQAAFAGILSDSAEQGEPEGMMATLPLATTVRKAAFSWGWDFGPNVPSIGIWRPVRLSVEPGAVITGHHVAVTELATDLTRAAVTVRVEASRPEARRASVRLVAPSGRVFDGGIEVSGGVGTTVLEIDDPELWWTHDLGEQPLHEVTIELVDGDTVLDRVSDRVGLRTIRVDRSDEPIEGGRLFCFVLNHVPIFARGANWLPPSMFVGSTTASDYHRLVRLARDGNLNMLRVWGGGIYGTDEFYAACDEEGVLVWQDFAFACTDYPSEDPTLQREVALEAEYNVRRLRNRASLALWSGNNEVHMIHLVAGSGLGPGNWGWHFFHEILPDAVARFDGLTTYWPGSPYGEGGPEAINGTQDGDRHTWEVWHGNLMGGPAFANKGEERHYRRYADDTARFVSEFGIHASPELDTLRRWIPESELSVHSRTFDLHNKDNPKNKGDELLAVTTGLPSSLVEYVEFTQAVQAEGMAFAIEHYRRRQPLTAGALMWEFNDVWPGFSWSIVDFDGIPKAAYFAASRASAPVAVSLRHLGDGVVEAWLVNNSRVPVDLEVDLEVGALDGTQRATERVRGAAPASGSERIWTGSATADAAHYVWASSPAGAFPSARLHFAQIRDLETGPSRLDVEVLDGALRIRSTGYSYLVRIEQPIAGVRLSDNCFDLRDGDERVISVTGADPGSLSVSSFPLSSGRGQSDG
jgi:beta-mannosidase